MSPGWEAEWRVALRRRRLFFFNVCVPLLLVAALRAGDAPAHHAAAVVAVLFTVFGVFGSAVPLVRDGDGGLLLRWLLAGVGPRSYLGGRVAAQSALDLLQLLPSVLLVTWGTAAGVSSFPVLAASVGLALLVANALGVWVASAARSVAEAALLGAVSALLLLHLGGVFRTPVPGSWQAAAEGVVPFRILHETALAALGSPGDPGSWGPALGSSAAFLLLTWAASPALLRRLAADGEPSV